MHIALNGWLADDTEEQNGGKKDGAWEDCMEVLKKKETDFTLGFEIIQVKDTEKSKRDSQANTRYKVGTHFSVFH